MPSEPSNGTSVSHAPAASGSGATGGAANTIGPPGGSTGQVRSGRCTGQPSRSCTHTLLLAGQRQRRTERSDHRIRRGVRVHRGKYRSSLGPLTYLGAAAMTSWVRVPLAPGVRRPVMLQHWRRLAFLHWPYRPALLPAGLEVDTFNGAAWVGLVPFLMDGVRPPGVPPLPWVSRFPETNVRTYARGPDGHSAIWFLSLDAARLGAVLPARAGYRLPYFWAGMSVRAEGARLAYRSRRRWPGPAGARCHADVELGEPFGPDELGPLDHFLTARYRLYTRTAGRLAAAAAEHPPWSLRRARVVDLEQDLLQAAGLPAPGGPAVVHASAGVRVRIGAWHPLPVEATGEPRPR